MLEFSSELRDSAAETVSRSDIMVSGSRLDSAAVSAPPPATSARADSESLSAASSCFESRRSNPPLPTRAPPCDSPAPCAPPAAPPSLRPPMPADEEAAAECEASQATVASSRSVASSRRSSSASYRLTERCQSGFRGKGGTRGGSGVRRSSAEGSRARDAYCGEEESTEERPQSPRKRGPKAARRVTLRRPQNSTRRRSRSRRRAA